MAKEQDNQPESRLEYRCKHCGKDRGSHKSITFHCPLPSRRRTFKDFNLVNVYEPTTKNPIKMRIPLI